MAKIYDFQTYRSTNLLERVADQSVAVGDCFARIGKSYNALHDGFDGMASALEASQTTYTEISHDLDERKHLYERCDAAMKQGASEEMSSLVDELQLLAAKRR
ncbi:MAG: hypothetical protein KAI73_08140 [Rhodospirillaceae bacterium]|nr:hypothetical protein [Rhodospirillaceae bacterium]